MTPDFEHDTRAAVDFLTRWSPDDLWLLTSIIPDGKTDTATFDVASSERAAAWIEARQGVQNIYFAVNPVRRKMTTKASKKDVARLVALHVDLDPRVGEDFDKERERALSLLQGAAVKPTVILDSGGGFQAFFRLLPEDCLVIDGDVSKARELERYNQQLERDFGADACHNVDRIMRLPGTINVPNAKKLKKGRKPALAKVVEWNVDAVYPITSFTAAPLASQRQSPASGKPRTKVPLGDAPGLDVDALTAWAAANGKTIKDVTLALVATGADPLEPAKYQSRSEVLFRVCCDLIRADVPDDVIFGVITGPNEVAASVRDKPDWKSYAQRQIERAHDEAVSPSLRELNDRHFVVMADGDKTRVITQMDDPTAHRVKLVSQSFADISNYYANRAEVVGKKDDKLLTVPLGKFWLTHPLRRTYHAMYFDPGKNGEGREVPGQYNLWRGWAVAPKPGDWSLMRAHIRNILASGNPEYDDYILRWAAWAVQNPDRQAETALVFRGARGAGKGVFGSALKNLFGRHGLQIFSPSQVTGKFNAHFLDCCLLFADESIIPGKDGGESQLKGLITETQLPIEKKGRDITTAANRLHVVMASNESWVVPAAPDERRFAVFDVEESKKQSKAYFAPLFAELDNGGLAAMLFDLLAMDLGDFHPRWKIPDTEALRRQKIQSLSGLDAYLYDLLCVGNFPVERGDDAKPLTAKGAAFLSTTFLRDDAARWLRARHGEQHVSGNEISDALEKLGATKYRRGGGGERGFLLPSLETMRERWGAMKFVAKWPTVVDADGEEAAPKQGDLADEVPPF